jgi:cytochrome c peroxidase
MGETVMNNRRGIARLLALTLLLSLAIPTWADDKESFFLPPPALDSEFRHPDADVVELGRMLFFDKELSGNRNISCATCHSPLLATVDHLSINIGTGGQGLGPLRDAGNSPPTLHDPQSRGSRNMSPLWNLGHEQFTKLFWDGRVQADASFPQGFATPAGIDLPFGVEFALDALSIFAQTDLQEMTGQPGTNELADGSLIHAQIGVWDGLVVRLGAIPEYMDLFMQAFPLEVSGPGDITIVHVGNAIGAFQAAAFRADDSPFDRYLRGDKKTMSKNAQEGMKLFYGEAECSTCHAGVFQTDHDFHAIGMPQIGPGFDPPEDFGREGFSGDPADRYRFRTPSLRNVVLTGPWGHNGFFNTLEGVVRHHLDPLNSLFNAVPTQAVLPPRPDLDALDLIAFNDQGTTAAIAAAIEIYPPNLSDNEVARLLDFLEVLTDFSAGDARKTVPTRVPSGLPLAETN